MATQRDVARAAGVSLAVVSAVVNGTSHTRMKESTRTRVLQAMQQLGYQPNQTPIEHQAELFARHVADYLLQAHAANRYEKLILAAGPEFLGLLRKLLDKQVSGAITQELNKDYTQVAPHDLLAQLKQHQT